MKTLKRPMLQAAAAGSMMLAIALPIASAHAQNTDIAKAAQDSCISSAQSKGFTLKEVVSVEPSTTSGAEGAKVVLNLTRDGQEFKLTCNYNPQAGAVIGDEANNAATAAPAAPAGLSFPWWWMLLPILGIPALLWFTGGRNGETEVVPAQRYVDRREAVVKNANRELSVYNGPDNTHSITGTLHDRQTIRLSGRQSGNWVELADGGWVDSRGLDFNTRYANH